MSEQMELIVIEDREGDQFLTVAGQQMKAVEVYTGPEGVEKIIAAIEAEIRAFVPDLTTDKGRKAIAAMAYKVSQSKVVLFNLGKSLTADWKAKAKKVDEAKATVEARLDALRDATRKPLTDWEEAEKARIAAEVLKRQIEEAHGTALMENDLFNRARELAAKEAELARIEAERIAKEEEAARAEAERIAAEKAEADRKEREAQIIRDAEEKAKREAEEAAAAAVREAQRKEHEAREAAERAEREKAEAAKRAEEEKAAAVREAEERARVESERNQREAETVAKADAERKAAELKAADVEHRRAVNKEIVACLVAAGISEKQAQNVVTSIIGGLVNHVRINY
jgi:colicin import membrane protein